MKRIYTIMSALVLAAMLLVGLISTFDTDPTYSERENRKLKTRPELTFSGLLDGSFVSNYRAYFADTFPNREKVMETNISLNGFYYFGGIGSNGGNLVLDFTADLQHGASADDPDTTEASSGETQEEQTASTTEEKVLPQQTEPEGEAEQLGNVLVIGDSAFDVPYAKPDTIRDYAATVTAIANLLGDDVQTISMPVPNSAEFYTTKEYHSDNRSQKLMIDLVRDSLGSNVTFVDAYSTIAQHTDEYIYFRTDHHWTHLGAYYAYTALCDTLGYTAEPRSNFETGQLDNFVGSMYTYIANYPQAQVLKNNPDTVYYWKPHADCTTYYYKTTELTNGVQVGTICKLSETQTNKYMVFMAGDHPITIVETDTDGPCILVIKESYGNALISWLTSHYSKIILIDPREYYSANNGIDLKAFAEQHGVDQCLIINYPMMLNSQNYIAKLKRLTTLN